MTKTTAALVAALLTIVILSSALIRTENQRYALTLGMCIDPILKVADSACLRKTETRTGWWWHLYYALTD